MFSVLLVEDERIELNILKNYVDWKSCGIERVYTARGARSAIECINMNEPDILFTDIQMPGMSGLELARLVRQEGHTCKIVFITSHERFDYAREAVSLHAEAFLLKPFEIEEVEELARGLVEQLDRERQESEIARMAMERVLDQACRGTLTNAETMIEKYFHMPASKLYFRLLAVKDAGEEVRTLIREMSEISYAFRMDPFLICVIPVQITIGNMVQMIRQTNPDQNFQIAYSRDKVGITDLYTKIHALFACRDDLFYSEAGCVMSDQEHTARMPYTDKIKDLSTKGQIVEMILTGNREKAANLTMSALEALKSMQQEGCCQNAFALFMYIHDAMEEKGNLDDEAVVPNILHAASFEVLKKEFTDYIFHCCSSWEQMKNQRMYSYVKKYVEGHYMETCAVEDMAEEIKLSPNYLRKKFKEESGMTILEYLTAERMRRAAEMLKSPNVKAREVAVAVGYENVSYFTQLFAKTYGATPNEYRKKYI